MQERYDDSVPNPEKTTPQRPIRVPDTMWEGYGRLVGGRGRSADLNQYIEWRLANPHVALATLPDEQVLDFIVRIRVITDTEGVTRRHAEITPLPGTVGPAVAALRIQVRQAIADHFNAEKASSASYIAGRTTLDGQP